MYIDDHSEELTLYRQFGRVETMDRGLGSKDITIGQIMNEYIHAAMHRI